MARQGGGAPPERPVTALLEDWRKGNAAAGHELIARLQPELRRMAANYMRHERSGHTLQPTALVSELFLKLMGGTPVEWRDRAHFLAVASRQLRRILVDYARERQAAKRGAGAVRETLDEDIRSDSLLVEEILDLHRGLEELTQMDQRTAESIALRYFGGLTESEAAEAMGISIATLKRDWEFGRAWLIDRLRGDAE